MISLADLQRRIESGELSADAAIAQSVEAIDAHEKAIGAFVCRAEKPRAQNAGPLRGIAVGIKDIIDTADFPTEMGSPIYRGFRPRSDAPVVMALKQAGATIIGKTTTTAFAANDPTADRQSAQSGHTPGGSSSGSAAAVGAGGIPLALGTQTGGSVIRPASYCGVAAINPSFRLLPTVGVKCFSWTLDTVGLFAAASKTWRGACGDDEPARIAAGCAAKAPRIGIVTQEFAGAPERRAPRRCSSQRKPRNAQGPRFVRSLCLTSSPKPGASIRTCRISRRIRRWPGSIATITTPCRRCCVAGWMKAPARPQPITTRRAALAIAPAKRCEASSTRSTCC